MDFCTEKIIKKKKGIKDFFVITLVFLITAFLEFVMLFVVMPLFYGFASIVLLVLVGIIIAAYFTISSFNVEYEYSLVNSELDVDKIINRKRRKKLTTVDLRHIDSYGSSKDHEFKLFKNDSSLKKVFACSSIKEEELSYLLYSEGTIKKLLVINPSEDIFSVVKKLNPRR